MQATQKYLRTSPRKLRLVADAVRGLPVSTALSYLRFTGKRAALPVAKVITAAAAAAKNGAGLSPQELLVKTITVGDGPTYKRWQAVSRGSAHSIRKHTAHLSVTLERKHGAKS